ncbi:MAG: hypothetical protein ACHQO8_02315 [Vicinamibacterales bacterium]
MTTPLWTYPPELLAALADLGLAPVATTPPAVVRDALNDLYRYELRRMRDALRAGGIPKAEYLDLVIALRKKYWPLTLPVEGWERVCRGGADAHRADSTTGD